MAQTHIGLFQRTNRGRFAYGRLSNYRLAPLLTCMPGGRFRDRQPTLCATFDPLTVVVGGDVNVDNDWDPGESATAPGVAGMGNALRIGGIAVNAEGGNSGYPRHPGGTPINHPLPAVARGEVSIEIGAESEDTLFGADVDVTMLIDGVFTGTAVINGDALGRVDQSTDVEVEVTVDIK